MKTCSPLARLPKAGQRRKLRRDVRRYQRGGGRITRLDSGSARGLSPVNLNDFEHLCGYCHEL